MTDLPPAATTAAAREVLGRIVRDTWIAWAREQPDPKPSWLVGWDELDESQREVDMRIGEALAAALPHLTPPPPDSETAVTVAAWTWDWREQPPLEDIAENIGARTSLHVYLPETGSDQYALVIASRVLSDSEVEEAWNR